MRHFTFFLALICLTFAAEEAKIIRHLNLEYATTCPDNTLHINATSSDGTPVAGVEIRLVLYVPYQGFKGLAHTDESGQTSIELSKNGSYRIYMYNTTLDHEKYVEFEYPRMCPPPPPKKMNISVVPDCDNLRLAIKTSANGTGAPLEGVFIQAGNWSSFTGTSGEILIPFEKGYVYLLAERANYTSEGFYFDARCLPPPECVSDADCGDLESCSGENCTNVTGECGYPENHTWVAYGCCADADCGNESLICTNTTCAIKPMPPEPPPANITNVTNVTNMTNQSNATGNESNSAEEETPAGACAGAFILALLLTFVKTSGLQFDLPLVGQNSPFSER